MEHRARSTTIAGMNAETFMWLALEGFVVLATALVAVTLWRLGSWERPER